MKKTNLVIVGVGALVVLALYILFGTTVNTSAVKIIETCAIEGDKSACYEREVPELLGTLSLSQVFDVIREIRVRDSSYQFCHVLAHALGERTVAEDPERWIDAMSKNPSDGLCSNGYIHGVVGGKFRSEVLDAETLELFLPDFSRACEPRDTWKPSVLDQAICYHGMGHLYVFITDADMHRALSLCERTAVSQTGDFRRVCIEGVFMQIYQPLEPDDFLMIERMTVKPTKETVREYCSLFTNDEYEGACLRESWPYFREELLSGGGAGFCLGQPNDREENACYESMFSILGRQTLSDPARAGNTCAVVPEKRRGECYSRVAMAYLEENRGDARPAISFCERAPEGNSEECLRFLLDRATFIFGNNPTLYTRFCVLLSTDLRQVCLSDITR